MLTFSYFERGCGVWADEVEYNCIYQIFNLFYIDHMIFFSCRNV